MNLTVIVFLTLAAVMLGSLLYYILRPEVPPIALAPDDPLMMTAIEKAKDSISLFRELAAQPNHGMRVKLPFVSSSGRMEFLWAEVLSLKEDKMEVRYLTPPVTHTGRLERLNTHDVSDLVDWQVELLSGLYAGGYTMRVMFIRGREQWGSLPPAMEAEEKKYH